MHVAIRIGRCTRTVAVSVFLLTRAYDRAYVRVHTRASEYASRIIGSEHLSYKIAMDTCQGNIKLRSSDPPEPPPRVRRSRSGCTCCMHMHVQDTLVDRDGKLRYHARPRVSLMRCGLTPLCYPTSPSTFLSLSLSTSSRGTTSLSTHYPNYTLSMIRINDRPGNDVLS